MSKTNSLVEIKNARVFRKETCVFKNLNLRIQPGESTAILGPNGSGKTTLLKLLTREIYPVVKEDSWIKLYGNESINIWDLRQKIGVVSHEFQSSYETMACGLDVVLSAFFGSTGLYEHHQVNAEQRLKALDIMRELKILDLQNTCFLKLSTGQQRRLLLARALVHQPDTLILDEPTSGLDLASAFQFIEDMRSWCQQHKTLILVSHHIQEIIPEIQRLVLIKEGKIMADGKKEDILNSAFLSSLFDTKLEVLEHKGYHSVIPVK